MENRHTRFVGVITSFRYCSFTLLAVSYTAQAVISNSRATGYSLDPKLDFLVLHHKIGDGMDGEEPEQRHVHMPQSVKQLCGRLGGRRRPGRRRGGGGVTGRRRDAAARLSGPGRPTAAENGVEVVAWVHLRSDRQSGRSGKWSELALLSIWTGNGFRPCRGNGLARVMLDCCELANQH